MRGRFVSPLRALVFFTAFLAFSFTNQYDSSASMLDVIKYVYDDQGRLKQVEYVDSGVTYDFSYDAAGNRTSHKVSGGSAEIRLWNTRIKEGGTLGLGVWVTQPGLSGVSVEWEVVPGLGDNPATLGADYNLASGKVEFPDGSQEVYINIPTIDDSEIEPFEQVYVRLKNPIGAPLDTDPLRTTKVGTIRDNDGVYFDVADTTISEGGLATLVVDRQGPLGNEVVVSVATTDWSAVAGSDYEPTIYDASNQPLVGGQLVFGANELSKTILVHSIDEGAYELDEAFWVDFNWTTPEGFAGWERAAVDIPNDDPLPEIHIGNAGNREGNDVLFSVWLSNSSYAPIEVTYRINSNGSNTEGYPNATSGDDYKVSGTSFTGSVNLPIISGDTITHVIAPGEGGPAIHVPTVGDTLIEPIFEAFYAEIVSVNGATIDPAKKVARGRIRDNDQDVTMTATAAIVDEGDGAANTITIPVTLSAAGKGNPETTVEWSVVGGTAVHGQDYTGELSGTVGIPFGETLGAITFETIPDTVYSADKTIIVRFSNWTDSSYSGGADVTSTIRNDDPEPAYFAASAVSALENVADRVFTITRSGNTAIAASVNYAITPYTAVYGEDYVAASGHALTGTLSFGVGETSKSVHITVVDDDIWEQRDDVRLTLSSPSAGAVITNAVADVWIGNDDGEPIINVFNQGIYEGNSNNVMNMVVFLQGGTMKEVTVTVKTTDGTAIAGQDYVAIPSYTVTLPPRTFEAIVPITILGDTTVESDETFNVEVVSKTNARTVTTGINAQNPDKGSNGTATLVNDDISYSYSWSYGSYGSWSACTGQSTQSRSRSATCKRSPDNVTVSGSYCGSASTTETRSCSYGWSYGSWGGWGTCQSNNTQTRTRSATCVSSTGHSVSGSKCGTATTSQTQSCSYYSYAWNTGAWSGYSACTGQAYRTRTRSVTCKRSPGGATVSDSSCSGSKPASSQNGTACSYGWNTSTWSGWSCVGLGDLEERNRVVSCKSNTGNTVSDSKCLTSKPTTYETRRNYAACGTSGGF